MHTARLARFARTVSTTFSTTKNVTVLAIIVTAFVGCGARHEGSHTSLSQITDGTSKTILAGTVSENRAVPWTKPDDIRLDDTFPSLKNSFADGPFMFADGSVRELRIEDGLNTSNYREAFTISSGKESKELYPPGHKFADKSPRSGSIQDALQYAQASKKRMELSGNLKKIASAIYKYHEKNKHLPPAIVFGPDGKPWHSWRVLILPFLGEGALHQQYDFGVPWDDPKNVAIMNKIPQIYRDPFSEQVDSNRTRYLVITGPGTAFPTMNAMPPTYTEESKTAESKPSNDAENQNTLNRKENADGSSITLTELEAIEEIKKLGGTVFPNPATNETSVVFTMSKVNDDGLVHLTRLKNVVSLILTSNTVTDKGLVHLEGLNGLKKLILSGTNFGDSGLVHLRGLTNLESINLGGTRFTNAGLVQIQQFSKLKSLGLSMTAVTDSGLQAINKMNQLQSLTLMGGFADAGLVHLEELQNLQTLMLNGNNFTDAGLLHLKELKSLQTLMLGGTKISDAGLAHLSGLTNLQNLHLNNTLITDAGLIHLAGLKTLTSLNLQKTGISDAGLFHFSEMSKLESLILSGTAVTEKGKNKLKQTNTNLKIH
jgi:hypothetical protein